MSLQDYSKQATFSDAAGDYLERHRVYELFQSMLRSLAIHKPKAPIPFLISTLTQRQDQKRIILGAPQNAELSSRNVQAAKIVKEFGVVHLRVSELVQEEVVKKTPLGIKARGFIEKGLEVPDAVSVAVIMNRISKQDCTTQGWLLDGFPNTQAQAQALQAAGCLANKFIYLNVPTDTLKFRLLDAAQREEKAAGGEEKSSTSSSMSLATPLSSLPRAAATFNAALPLVQRIETQATAIECRLASVAQQFTHCCAVINDVADTNVVYTNIANFIKAVEASDAPRRPQRVLVLGPLGAGKSTVALKLAEKYDLVHLSVGSLLRSESEKPSSSSAKRTDAASSYAAMGEPIPDHIVGPMILERLQQDDCKSRGWILEGFPRTLHQVRQRRGHDHYRHHTVIYTCASFNRPHMCCFSRYSHGLYFLFFLLSLFAGVDPRKGRRAAQSVYLPRGRGQGMHRPRNSQAVRSRH